LEAWEKVYVESQDFLESIHNEPNCIGCHGGTPDTDDKAAAHVDIIKDPTIQGVELCATCHADEAQLAGTSLHYTLNGYKTVMAARGMAVDNDPVAQQAFDNHCSSCHATCGECHVSRPRSAGGGLIAGHEFKRIASISNTCLACHGGRVGPEYQGKNEGIQGDVHWFKGGMPCIACHQVADVHGDGTPYTHRFDGPPTPNCLDCHPDVSGGKDGVTQHAMHEETVACQVCHSAGPYKSCYNCHVGQDDQGLAFFKTDPSQMTFKIGRNPAKSEDRPWNYVLVRHIPTARDTFAFYGADLLPNYDDVPTWKYAPVHNIQRVTPQNQACNNCHGQTTLFLTVDDIAPDELAANGNVIVESIPEARQ
jgi:thiosulfate/3-mercaptopyruvate sulfurtransferase